MNRYYLTEKFTLIPDMFFSVKGGELALRESHRLNQTDIIREHHLKSLHAHIVYAIPEEVLQADPEKEVQPFIACLATLLETQSEYNKVLFHYSLPHKLAHVLISKGDRLQLANAYIAENIESAIYFLFLAIKQTIVNPIQTKLLVYNPLSEAEQHTLENYFQEIQIHNLPTTTQLI